MRTLERYVFRSFMTASALAWVVLSFVLTLGLLGKLAQLAVKGLPLRALGLFAAAGFPGTLPLTVPLALLVGALLVFGRLSADGEIAAMRACGVNLLRIMKWPAAAGLALSLAGSYINHELVPRSHERQAGIKSAVSMDAALGLLEPGSMIDVLPGFKLFFARRDGNWLRELRVFDSTQDGVMREIRSEKALVSASGADVVLELFNASIDPVAADRPGVATAERYTHVIPDALKSRRALRKEKDMRFAELRRVIGALREKEAAAPDEAGRRMLSVSRTEYHLRYVYAAASLCFVLVGMPLGIRARGGDSAAGMAGCLAVGMAYYLSVILFHSLDRFPEVRAYGLLWLPVLGCGVFAACLVPRKL